MKLIILDRDGVINEDSDSYIKSPQEWIPIPGSLEALGRLKSMGYTIAIATNQSGIGRGYYTVDTLNAMHDKMQKLAAPFGGYIDLIQYCPHTADINCLCRKPLPGMIHTIAEHFHLQLDETMMIGDTLTDYQAATAAGIGFALVKTGKGMRTLAQKAIPNNVSVFENLADYVAQLSE